MVSTAVAGAGTFSEPGGSAGNGGPALQASFEFGLNAVVLAPALPSGAPPFGFSAEDEGAHWFRADNNTSLGNASFARGSYGPARYAFLADRVSVRAVCLADPAAPEASPLRHARVADVNILGSGTYVPENARTRVQLGRPGNESAFTTIARLALDVSGGRLFVSLEADNMVVAVSLSTGIVSPFAGQPDGPRLTSPDGEAYPAVNATFGSVAGIAWDEVNRRLFICEPGGKKVRAVTPRGTMQAVAGGGASFFSSSGVGAAATSYFFVFTVSNVALAPSGDMLYVLEGSAGIVAVRVAPDAPFTIAAVFSLTNVYRSPMRLAGIAVVNASMPLPAGSNSSSAGSASSALASASASGAGAGGVTLLFSDVVEGRLFALRLAANGVQLAGGGTSVASALSALTPVSSTSIGSGSGGSGSTSNNTAIVDSAADFDFMATAPDVDPISRTVYATAMSAGRLRALTCAPASATPSPSASPSSSATRSFGFRTAAELAEAAVVTAAATQAEAAAASARSAGIAAGVIIPSVAVPVIVAALAVAVLYVRRSRARRRRAARSLARLVAAQRMLALHGDLLEDADADAGADNDFFSAGATAGSLATNRKSARGSAAAARAGARSGRSLLDGLALLAAVVNDGGDNAPLLPISAGAAFAATGRASASASTGQKAAFRTPTPSPGPVSRGQVQRLSNAGGGKTAVGVLQAAVASQVARGLFSQAEAAAAAAAAAAARNESMVLSPGKRGVVRSARLSGLSVDGDDDRDGDAGATGGPSQKQAVMSGGEPFLSDHSSSAPLVPARIGALEALSRALPDAQQWERAVLLSIGSGTAPLANPQRLLAQLHGHGPALSGSAMDSVDPRAHTERGVLLAAVIDKAVDALLGLGAVPGAADGTVPSPPQSWFATLDEASQRALASPEVSRACASFLVDQYHSLLTGDAALPASTAALPLPLLLQAVASRSPAPSATSSAAASAPPLATLAGPAHASIAVADMALEDWRASVRSARRGAARRSSRKRRSSNARATASDAHAVAIPVEIGFADADAAPEMAAAASNHAGASSASTSAAATRVDRPHVSGAVETKLFETGAVRRVAAVEAMNAGTGRPGDTGHRTAVTAEALDMKHRSRAAVEALVLLSLSGAAGVAARALIRTVAADDADAADDDPNDAALAPAGAAGPGSRKAAVASSIDLAIRVEQLLRRRSSSRKSSASAARRSRLSSALTHGGDHSGDDAEESGSDEDGDSEDSGSEYDDEDDDAEGDREDENDVATPESSDGEEGADGDADSRHDSAGSEDEAGEARASHRPSRGSRRSRHRARRRGKTPHGRKAGESGLRSASGSRSHRDMPSDNPLHKRGSHARGASAEEARRRIHELLAEQLSGLTSLAHSADHAARRSAWRSAVATVLTAAMRVACFCCLRCSCCNARLHQHITTVPPAGKLAQGSSSSTPPSRKSKWSSAPSRQSVRPGSSLHAMVELHRRDQHAGRRMPAGTDAFPAAATLSPLVLMLARAHGLSLEAAAPAVLDSGKGAPNAAAATTEQQRRMRVALAARQQPAALHHHQQAALALQAAELASLAAAATDPHSTSALTFVNSPLLSYVAARPACS